MDLCLRRLYKRDVPKLVRIEGLAYASPWGRVTFVDILSCCNIGGYCAVANDEIVGYLIYCMTKHNLHIENIATKPVLRRQGIGTALVRRLQLRLSKQSRRRVVACVRESRVGTQLFLQSLGFTAVRTDTEYYADEDAIIFHYSKQPYLVTQ